MLTGIDIASYQAGIPQSVIAQADVVVVKATEGTNYVNPELFDQFSKAVNAGKKVGVYHYAHAGDPIAQADYFITKTREAQLTPDFWVLDFEEPGLLADEDFALRFLDRVHSKTGQVVWFYCYMNPLKQYGYRRIRDAGWKLWLAGYPYGQQAGFGPRMTIDEYIVFSGFNSAKWDFAGWQYSSQGRLPGWGGDLDFNVFFEDAFTSGNDKPRNDLSVPAVSMVYPAPPSVPISQEFGQNGTSYNLATGGHTGRDYANQMNTPVYAMANGTVLWADYASNLPGDDSNAGWESRWLIHKSFAGIVVVLDHGMFLSVYAHLNRTDLNSGDTVRAGQQIALSGNTGSATTGPHLHWEVIPQPFAWWTNGYFGRVHPGRFLESNKASVASVAVEQKDEFDMANIEEVFTTKRKAWGGRSLDELFAEVDRNTWNTKKMVRYLFNQFRIGTPGVMRDGMMGSVMRKLLNYNEAENGMKRKAEWVEDGKRNYDF